MAVYEDEHVSFWDSADIGKLAEPFLSGHDDELLAVGHFVEFLGAKNMNWSMMLFGWPGTAKTVFPRALAYGLNRAKHPCGMAVIRCQHLTANLSVDEVRDRLGRIDAFVRAKQEPKIMVFDELDALAPSRVTNPGLLPLATWAMDFFDFRHPSLTKSIIIGITNDPSNVEPAVRDRMPCSLFFDAPNSTTVADILGQEGMPSAKEVADALCQELAGNGQRATGRGAYHAARLTMAAHADITKVEPPDVAHFMAPMCSSASEHELEQYRQRHSWHVSKSREFVTQWKDKVLVAAP